MIYQAVNRLDTIRFRSRPEAVAEQLRNAILTGALKPGDRLVEQKVAAKFGIGQPTVREALKELELQGFVRKTTKKHTHVTELSREDYCKMLEVRLALEPLAIGRAAQTLTPAVDEELELYVSAMEVAACTVDLVAFHQCDLQFHSKIWDLAGNEHLTVALERVAFALFAFVLLQRKNDDSREFLGSAKQHRQILEGLRSGHPGTACNAFLESTSWFWHEYHGIDLMTPQGQANGRGSLNEGEGGRAGGPSGRRSAE